MYVYVCKTFLLQSSAHIICAMKCHDSQRCNNEHTNLDSFFHLRKTTFRDFLKINLSNS